MSTGIQTTGEQVDIAALEQALTLKQRLFVDAWFGEAAGNATKAAQIAGYEGSYDTVRYHASRTLTNGNVRAYIDAMLLGLGINPQSMLLQLAEGIYGNAFEGIDLGNLTPSELGKLNSRLIKRITVTEASGPGGMQSVSIEPVDRAEYIKLAMRALGMDIRKLEVTGAGGGPMLIKQVQPPQPAISTEPPLQLDTVEGQARELPSGEAAREGE